MSVSDIVSIHMALNTRCWTFRLSPTLLTAASELKSHVVSWGAVVPLDEAASQLVSLSLNTRIFYSITSDIDCSNLLGRGHPTEFLQAQDMRDHFDGWFVATNYAMKIVPPLECRGEPNPSLVTWTSSSLMVPTSRDVFTAYDSDTSIVRILLI